MPDNEKRIIDLTSTTVVGNDDGFVVDSVLSGTRKVLYSDVANALGTTFNISDIRTKANGAMQKSVYDANNDGIVDNASKVNNHTVDKNVPSDAKFTDTVYDDTEVRGLIAQKLDASDYRQFTGATDSQVGTAGIAPAPQQTDLYLSSNGSWAAPDASPTDNSKNLVTSGGVKSALDNKVDKDGNKGLSTEDYTTAEKTKLSGLPDGTTLASDLATKVDKVAGKGLSTEDYTTADKTKLGALPDAATLNADLASKQSLLQVTQSISGGYLYNNYYSVS